MVIRQLGSLDGRGRDLQQVETGSRFWWRALDAQTPSPVLPRTAPATRPATRPNTDFQAAFADRSSTPSLGLTLQVPKGDRRRKQRRPKSKGFGGLLIAALLVVVAGSAAAFAISAPAFALRDVKDKANHIATRGLIAAGFGIDQVSLTGQRYTPDTDVYDALDLANVTTFAGLDTAAALKRIERLAWVDAAQITRVFPGVLNVEIKERIPAAIWSRGDKHYLIDATGRTLGPVPAHNDWQLPRLAGEGANVDAALLLTAVSRHKDIQGQFNYAERIGERRWRVVMKNGSRIELGADREVEGLDQVATNITLRGALADAPEIIDVRTAGRAVMRPLKAAATAQLSPAQTSRVQSP
jgi:cell division protein FtsQ